MIKINLLPKTINQKRIIRNTAVAFAILLVVIIAAGMAYGNRLKGQVADMEQQAAAVEAWKTRVEEIKAKADQVTASIQPMQQKLDFINKVLDYNKQYPKLYEEVATWTYEKVTLDNMISDGTQLQMQARVKTLDDLGRYLLNMYRATDLFTEVTISGIPGYGNSGGQSPMGAMGPMAMMAAPGGGPAAGPMSSLAGIGAIESSVERAVAGAYAGGSITFTVNCKLKTPIVAPQFGGATQQAGQSGASPMGGMPMGPMGPGGGMAPAPGM